MKHTEEILRIALVGLENSSQDFQNAPKEIADILGSVEFVDNEDQFLYVSALVLNYELAGTGFPKIEIPDQEKALPETRPYVSKEMQKILEVILDISQAQNSLMNIWVSKCVEKGLILTPEQLTIFLPIGISKYDMRNGIRQIAGERGKWLASLNENWKYLRWQHKEIWEEGSQRDRIILLRETRLKDPAEAREMIIAEWKVEKADTRASFLSVLENELSHSDLEFLYSCLEDRSKRVREQAEKLLLSLPESRLSQIVRRGLNKFIKLKTHKTALGLMSSEQLEFSSFSSFDETWAQLSISPESPDNSLSNGEYFLTQLLHKADPALLEQLLSVSPSKFLKLLKKDTAKFLYLSAIIDSTIKFRNVSWADAILNFLERQKHEVEGEKIYELFTLLDSDQWLNWYQSGNYKSYVWMENSNAIRLSDKKKVFLISFIDFLKLIKEPLDYQTSLSILKDLDKIYSNSYPHYLEDTSLLELAAFLHPSLLGHKDKFLQGGDTNRYWQKKLSTLFRHIAIHGKLSLI